MLKLGIIYLYAILKYLCIYWGLRLRLLEFKGALREDPKTDAPCTGASSLISLTIYGVSKP